MGCLHQSGQFHPYHLQIQFDLLLSEVRLLRYLSSLRTISLLGCSCDCNNQLFILDRFTLNFFPQKWPILLQTVSFCHLLIYNFPRNLDFSSFMFGFAVFFFQSRTYHFFKDNHQWTICCFFLPIQDLLIVTQSFFLLTVWEND